MVLILEGNSKTLLNHGEKYAFSKKKNPICDFSRSNKCLKQIKNQRLLLTCAPISEVPSNTRTMVIPMFYIFDIDILLCSTDEYYGDDRIRSIENI